MDNILLYEYAIFSLSIHSLVSIQVICIGWLLWIMLPSTSSRSCFQFFLYKCIAVDSLGHVVVCAVFCNGQSVLHSHQRSSKFCIFFPTFVIFLPQLPFSFLNNGHSDRFEAVSPCRFDQYFSDDYSEFAIFSFTHWQFQCLLWRNVCPLFSWVILLQLFEILLCFEQVSLSRYVGCKHFIPLCAWPFCSVGISYEGRSC